MAFDNALASLQTEYEHARKETETAISRAQQAEQIAAEKILKATYAMQSQDLIMLQLCQGWLKDAILATGATTAPAFVMKNFENLTDFIKEVMTFVTTIPNKDNTVTFFGTCAPADHIKIVEKLRQEFLPKTQSLFPEIFANLDQSSSPTRSPAKTPPNLHVKTLPQM
jgi:hypothetical protein